MATLSYDKDFLNEKTRAYLEKYIIWNPKVPADVAHRIWRFIENVAASPMGNCY